MCKLNKLEIKKTVNKEIIGKSEKLVKCIKCVRYDRKYNVCCVDMILCKYPNEDRYCNDFDQSPIQGERE